jgi:hypothetical protein
MAPPRKRRVAAPLVKRSTLDFRMSRDDRATLTLAKERFELEGDATTNTRLRELDDLAFYAGEQWDPATLIARQAQQGNTATGLPPVPARPCLVINKVKAPIRQVTNQQKESDFGIELIAADDFEELAEPIDDTELRLREGLTRKIQRMPETQDARDWAFSRATIAGRGFYCIMTRYMPGKTFWQEPYVHRIFNQNSVSLDPAHEQPDGSDAEWGFIGNDVPWNVYKHDFPKNADDKDNILLGASDAQFRQLGADEPGWFTQTDAGRAIRVLDYWYVEREHRDLALLQDGSSAWVDELTTSQKKKIVDTRNVVEKSIKWCKIDGAQILEKTDWLGPHLPIVKVLGEELHPYDNERRTEGMIRSARDAQQGFNAMVSKWVESVGLAPIPPFQLTPEQVAGFEKWYQLANTRTLPYLPYNSTSEAGQPIGPPQRTNVDTPIQAIAASVSMFDQAIQSTTGVPESRAAGQNNDSRLRSGKAIEALQTSSEQGTSNYLDNLKRSMKYEAQILNGLYFPLYGQPGRLTRIVNGEGDEEVVRVNIPGQPMPPQGRALPGGLAPKPMVLTKNARFNIAVKITRQFETRRQEEVAIIAELLTANPQLMTWFGDLFFKNQDGPGHKEMAERARAMLDPRILEMMRAKMATSLPPDVTAALSAKDRQIKAAEAAIQHLKGELDSKNAEIAGKVKVAEIGAKKDIEVQERRGAATIAAAHIAANAKGATLDAHAAEELAAMGATADEADAARAHELLTSTLGHAQGLEQSQLEHNQTMTQQAAGVAGQAALAEQGQGHALEQQDNQAALTPPEEPGA